jgi:hypothetical protein
MNGGWTSCTTVSAVSQFASYFFDIGDFSSVVFSAGGDAGDQRCLVDQFHCSLLL